jgi:hypothetical protein
VRGGPEVGRHGRDSIGEELKERKKERERKEKESITYDMTYEREREREREREKKNKEETKKSRAVADWLWPCAVHCAPNGQWSQSRSHRTA